MNKGAGDAGFDLDAMMAVAKSKDAANKRLSVERIYQKKTQLEHILLRPDTYIGSVEKLTQTMWVFDEESESMTQRELTFVPGLYKIFDEILVNAADNKQRDAKMNCIKIEIDPEANKISIWNNGKGIPVVEHKVEKVYVPTLIFGTLLTSSNYNDDEKKVTGGRNGYGAKLCNIFSKKFVVETNCNEYKKHFKQTWTDNMGKTTDAKIHPTKGDDFTSVTFYPDLEKFGMEKLDKDTCDLFTRRAYDIAASTPGVKVILNGKRLPVKSFKDYIDLYVKDKTDDNNQPYKVVYEKASERWEVAITLSDRGFQSVSFVNSIATTKGGRHVDYVTDQIVSKLIEAVKKKQKKDSMAIKPFQVKNHMWVFVNCLIENPTFDSQTKENMTLQAKNFGSKCALSEKFVGQAVKCGIVESILSWMTFKAQEKLNKKCGSSKQSKLKGIPKLDDANEAGTKNSLECILILTEGDSAKSLAVAGLGVVGRDRYGVFPLKGKVLNVREATHKQIMENAEINNIIKIIGLRYKEKYETPESMKTLRYGKIMIMTDQDQDGSHIKGLLINFIHHNWPGLLKKGFVEEFITPIVKVTKNKQELSFFSLPEFEEWKRNTDNYHTWRVKYYKGLGTSSSKEAKEYFSDMNRHRIPFKYSGVDDDAAINLAFSKKKIEERKEWLTNWMEERKRRSQLDLPEIYLYSKETKHITYNEFVNRELILFSNMDNERSIPCLVDGFKPGQRKVIFTCLKRNLVRELKVAQLAGSVAELSAYHHGENSLMSTIINLAQNFVGSNNINLLQPNGQFGTRLHGGKDAASPRYIFTCLSTLTRHVFNTNDDAILKFLKEDNQSIEPEWYVPIIPMVLVNGAEGIGTGWSTKIPNHDPRAIVKNLLLMIDGNEPQPMLPWYKNFTGVIENLAEGRIVVYGEVSLLDEGTVEISELPVGSWTQAYKENVLEPMLQGSEKTPAVLQDYKEYHTDTTVRFVVKLNPDRLLAAEAEGLHKYFKLQSTISTNSMVLFDHNGCIKRYSSTEEILKEFFTVRLEHYAKRKSYLEGVLQAESMKLDNQARFITEKIAEKIKIEGKRKRAIIDLLIERGYERDPIKAWRASQRLEDLVADKEEEDENEDLQADMSDFNYILSLPMSSLSKEEAEKKVQKSKEKADELYAIRKKSPEDLWKIDLKEFLSELDKVEAQERAEAVQSVEVNAKTSKGRKTVKKFALEQTKPSPIGRRVEPKIDLALRQKAVAAQNKKTKVKKEQVVMDDDDDEPKSLADRVGGHDLSAEKKKPTKPRTKKTSGDKPKSSPKKKAKKRNPWSTDSEDSDVDENIMSFTDTDEEEEESTPPPKMVKTLDLSDEDAEEAPPKPLADRITEEKKPASKQASKPRVKKAGTPKKKTKKRNPWSTDEEDDNEDHMSIDSTPPSKPVKASDLSDDADEPKPLADRVAGNAEKKKVTKPKKTQEPKKKAKKPNPWSDDDEAETISDDEVMPKKQAKPQYDSDDEDEPKPVVSASEKISNGKKAAAKSKPKKRPAEKADKVPKKKIKKKNPWSDSEDDEDMDEVVPRQREGGRRAAAAAATKYNFSDSDSDFA